MSEEKDIQSTNSEEETVDEATNEPTYRFEWDYTMQCEHDRQEMQKKRKRGAWTFAIVMSCVFLVCIVLLVGVLWIAERSNQTPEPIPTEEIAELVMPQTVLITTNLSGNVGYGTGFFIRSDGYIATNHHVIEDADEIEVILYSGVIRKATVVGYSAPDDLAVLKIDGQNYPTASIGNSDALRVGATAIAIGNPMGTSYAWTTTKGIISATDRVATFSDDIAAYEVQMLQTDAPVNSGNSGGPLCNDQGEVIGIVTRKAVGYDYIGLALPINGSMTILNEIIEHGTADHITSPITRTRPLMGITCTEVKKGESYSFNNTPYVSEYDGVLIHEVSKQGVSAEKIQPGDILVSLNGMPVTSMDDLTNILYGCKLGQTVHFEVIRNGQSVTGTITFATK